MIASKSPRTDPSRVVDRLREMIGADRVELLRGESLSVGGEAGHVLATPHSQEEMAEALAGASITGPIIPIIDNVTARPESDPEAIRRLLVEQVTGRVRWRESMEWMAGEGGATRFVEIGSGKVLTGMAKRIAPDAEALAVNGPEEIEAFARGLD